MLQGQFAQHTWMWQQLRTVRRWSPPSAARHSRVSPMPAMLSVNFHQKRAIRALVMTRGSCSRSRHSCRSRCRCCCQWARRSRRPRSGSSLPWSRGSRRRCCVSSRGGSSRVQRLGETSVLLCRVECTSVLSICNLDKDNLYILYPVCVVVY